MRRIPLILLPLILTLTSCDQKARDFAKSAKALLDEYASRIDGQIQIESQYYQRDAVLEAKHRHENLLNSATADRSERFSEALKVIFFQHPKLSVLTQKYGVF